MGAMPLAGGLAVCVLFAFVAGALAWRKGYSFAAWFGTGGAIVLTAIALGFLPSVRNPSLSGVERAKLTARGNRIGASLSFLLIALVVRPTDAATRFLAHH